MRTPNRQQAHSPRIRFSLFLGRLLRFLLILALVLQGIIITVAHHYRDIPVPDFLLQRLHQQLATHDLWFTSKSIKIDPYGQLIIKNAEIYHNDFDQPLIITHLAVAEFSLIQLLIGTWALESIRVADATLFCPPLYSPSGVTEKGIENIFLDMELTYTGLTIHNLQLQSGPLRTSIQGHLPQPLLNAQVRSDTTRQLIDITTQLHQALQHLETWISQRKILQHVKQPTLRILFHPDQQAVLQANVKFHSLGITHPAGLQTGPISAQCVFNYNQHWTLQGHASYLNTAYARWQNQVASQAIHIKFPTQIMPLDLVNNAITKIIPHTEIHAHAVTINGLNLDAITLDTIAYDATTLQGAAFLSTGKQYIELQAAIECATHAGTIELNACWNPTLLLALDSIPSRPIFDQFTIPDAPSIEASLDLGPGFSIERIDYTTEFSRIAYRDIDLVHLSVQGHYANSILDIEAAHLISNRYAVTGSYWQNLSTQDYRFLLEGTIDPTDLNSIIREDWWQDLWPMFEFHSELPYSNIDLRGRYFGGASHRRIFAFNHFKDTSFRNTRLRQFTGYLLGLPKSIRLHQLKAEGHRGGNTDIEVQWDYRNGPSSKYMTQFAGSSSLPLDDAARMIGQETRDFVADFAIDHLPYLKACGILFGKNSHREGEEFLQIRGEIDHPVSYRSVNFDFVNFTAFKTAQYVKLRDFQFGLGQGIATGEIDVSLTADPPYITFDAALERAQYQKIVAAMPTVFEAQNEKKPDNTPQNPSHIDLQLRGQGPFSNVWQLVGEGRLQVYDTDFGRLHLMGALSRYFYNNTKLTFGSLKFDRAASTFRYKNGVFSFPDVIISGPSARINASGQLKLPEKALDFELLLSPFSEVETPIISQLLYIFNPLAKSLKAELTGTIDDPLYDIDFKPLKVFTGNTLNPPPATN